MTDECAMRIFAGALTGLIEIIIVLVIVGIAAINKILAARKEQEPPVGRPQRRPLQPAQAGVNPMETRDVDQFLDEVLGRGAAARPPAAPAGDKPVVLRPTTPPIVPKRTQPEVRRPIARPAVPRGARPTRPPTLPVTPAPQPKVRSKFSESVQKDVDKAAAATQDAAMLTSTNADEETKRRQATTNDVLSMLRSPEDMRRAIIVREILGPPVAMRKRNV